MAGVLTTMNVTANLDSEAIKFGGSHAKAVMTEFAKQGMDLEAMVAKSWAYRNNKNKPVLYWTTADISTLAPGTEVYVMRYKSERAYCRQRLKAHGKDRQPHILPAAP